MAKDIIHDSVKNSFIQDGWTITDDPLTVVYEDARVFVDLGAERVIAAERNSRKIAVEIKSFVGPSAIRDVELALGQFVLYRTFLGAVEAERRMYMAIPYLVYQSVFERKSIKFVVEHNNIPLVVVDVDQERIIEWIEN